LCEGTGSNIFIVVDGQLITPTLASGCLAGITRELVVEWSGAQEVDVNVDALERASEVFLTSSTRDVQPVHAVDERRMSEAPGSLTAAARETFLQRSAADIDP
jgi:branched-chain amino acid aminotransferase